MSAKAQVFAIMRNGHEVIRGASQDLHAMAEQDNAGEFSSLWSELRRWEALHAQMEDGVQGRGMGMFAVLENKFPGCTQPLLNNHPELEKKQQQVDQALANGDFSKVNPLESAARWVVCLTSLQVNAAYLAFEEANLAHLGEEEGIMMPKVSLALHERLPPCHVNLCQPLSGEGYDGK
jgi:hypothetical protein